MSRGSVFLGYCDYGHWQPEYGESLVDFFLHDAFGSQHIGGRTRVRGPYIPQNRTRIVEAFLETECEWLWMLDIDLAFPAGILDGLMSVADPAAKPIVAALYFSSYDSTPAGTWWPLWMEPEGEGSKIVTALKLGEVRELSMAGTGCMVIHRSVLTRLAEVHPEDPWPWFGHDIVHPVGGPQRAGEDVTFCTRARNAGFTVWGLTVPLKHYKTIEVGWDNWVSQCQKEEADAVPARVLSNGGGPLPVDQFRNRAERRHQPKGLRPVR